MQIVTTVLPEKSSYGDPPPSHGVFSLWGWETLKEKAYPISVHWDYQSAFEAAARDELFGNPRVLVCFEWRKAENNTPQRSAHDVSFEEGPARPDYGREF